MAITMDQTQTFIYIKLSLALSEASVTQQFRFELIQPFMKHLRSEGYCELLKLLIVVVCCCHIYWVLVQLCLETKLTDDDTPWVGSKLASTLCHFNFWKEATCQKSRWLRQLGDMGMAGCGYVSHTCSCLVFVHRMDLFGTRRCHDVTFLRFAMKFTCSGCSGKHNTIHGVRACTRQYAAMLATNQTSCAWPDHDLLVLHFHITWGHKFKAPAKFP